MYSRPTFFDEFDRPDGEILSPWINFEGGTVYLQDGNMKADFCGIGLLPFTDDSFYAAAQVTSFLQDGSNMVSIFLSVDDSVQNGFSLTLQTDLTLHVEATINGNSTVIAVIDQPIDIGDTILIGHYKDAGVDHIKVMRGWGVIHDFEIPTEYLSILKSGRNCGIWLTNGASIGTFGCGGVDNLTLPLVPLQKTWSANELEKELGDLFVKLYKEHLDEQESNIGFYGMPHLGNFGLVERLVTQDGLSVIRQGDEAGMRYLYRAWRHNNPKRGLHFPRTYLQVLFGNLYEVQQLWQLKAGTYPNNLKTEDEIAADLESIDDYFLTSRIRADIDTDVIPQNIVGSIRTALAARFVLEMRVAKFSQHEFFLGNYIKADVSVLAEGQTISPPKVSKNDYTMVSTGGASVVFNGYGETLQA